MVYLCEGIDRLSFYSPVPIVSVHVDVKVVNFTAQVEVTQEFINMERNPKECVYFFPVEEEADGVDFTAELEGRKIKTQIKEKEAARTEYIQAVKNDEGSSVAMLSFVRESKLKDHPLVAAFLVNCSGSMSGHSMKLAKEALQVFLHSLPVNSYFNIIIFGSTFQSLFYQSRRYDDAEIYKPLQHIFQKPLMAGFAWQIFVLTDGQVSNSSASIEVVWKNSSNNRVFTLDIGSTADRHLVKGMARVGMGTIRHHSHNIASLRIFFMMLLIVHVSLCDQMFFGDNPDLVEESDPIQGREHIMLMVVLVGDTIDLGCFVASSAQSVSDIRWTINGQAESKADNQIVEKMKGKLLIEDHFKITNITEDMDGDKVSCEYAKGHYAARVEAVLQVFKIEIEVSEVVCDTCQGNVKLVFSKEKGRRQGEANVEKRMKYKITKMTHSQPNEITVEHSGYSVLLPIDTSHATQPISTMRPKFTTDWTFSDAWAGCNCGSAGTHLMAWIGISVVLVLVITFAIVIWKRGKGRHLDLCSTKYHNEPDKQEEKDKLKAEDTGVDIDEKEADSAKVDKNMDREEEVKATLEAKTVATK